MVLKQSPLQLKLIFADTEAIVLATIIKSIVLGLVLGATVASAALPAAPAARCQRSTHAILRTLVAPGVPNGTPAVITTRWPGSAIFSR